MKHKSKNSSKPTAWERNGYASEEAYFNYQRDYYRRNREKISRKRKADIWADRLSGARKRAKELGMEFNITREYLDSIYVSHCPILGIELSYVNDRIYPNSASIDRIDNSIGYVVGNIQILSYKANRIKGDASIEELIRFADYIHSKYKLTVTE